MKFSPPNAEHVVIGSASSYKHILVPVDFSECSFNALRQALLIALRSGASVELLHVINLPLKYGDFIADSIDKVEIAAHAELDALAAEVGSWLHSHGWQVPVVTTHCITGFPAEEIVNAANAQEVDLLVMGTNGADGIEAFVMGSNAATVIANAGCPVLAMPADILLYNLDKVVFATDLELLDPDAIQDAADLAGLYDAKLDLLHLFTPSEAIAPAQLAAFEAKALEICEYPQLGFVTFETFHSDLSQSLEQYIREYKVELMALLKRDRGFWSGLFHTSVTKKLTLKAQIPMLILHE